MKKRPVKWLVLPLLILGTLALTSYCILGIFNNANNNNDEPPTETRYETYSIDSSTLLDSVKSGKTDVFTLLKATPAVYPSPSLRPVHWTEQDYFAISHAFQQFAWKDSLDGWKLGSMTFTLDCEDISFSPLRGAFTFSKMVNSQNTNIRIERTILIDAKDNDVNYHEFEFGPNAQTLSSIDLSKSKITMQDALQIAEKNGGTKARSGVNNNCSILADFDVNGAYKDGWLINYFTTSADNSVDLLWLDVNAQTGACKVITQS
jgi:hypothetical protein